MAAVIRSYRRSDGAARCVRLSDRLSLRFGEDIVFRDVDDLQPGVRWWQIQAALRGAKVGLALKRRITEPHQ